MKAVFLLWAILAFGVTPAEAHQVILDVSCKQGSCYHTLLRNFDPPEVRKTGILKRYETSFVEKRCKPDEAMDIADCRLKHPAIDEFTKFTRTRAFCSRTSPAIFSADLESSGGVMGNFLDIAGEIPAYQETWILEYLVVCHGWAPSKMDDQFAKNIAALGYKPLGLAVSSKKFVSEVNVEAFLSQDVASNPSVPSVKALEGKWYSDNVRVCKGIPGETEGLLTFRGTKFVGLENECTIGSSKANGRVLQLQMSCAGEGMVSRETEQIEFLNDRQIKRTVADGKKRYSFVLTRCP